MVYLMKVAIFGEKGVGITSILNCLNAKPVSCYEATLGGTHCTKDLPIGNKCVKFQFWNPRARPEVRRMYFLGALGGVAVYDVTRPLTLNKLKSQIEEFWRDNGEGIIPVIVIGNKIDMRSQIPNSVETEEGVQFCWKLSEMTISKGFEIPFIETSAKTGANIREAFDVLGRMHLKRVAESELQIHQD